MKSRRIEKSLRSKFHLLVAGWFFLIQVRHPVIQPPHPHHLSKHSTSLSALHKTISFDLEAVVDCNVTLLAHLLGLLLDFNPDLDFDVERLGSWTESKSESLFENLDLKNWTYFFMF